ncbi:MAG: signal peptidase I [Pseudomonadota bacterium]
MSVDTDADQGEERGSAVGETVRIIIHALLLAVLVRLFLFQPFNIPSGSMKSTLLVGDYLFVSKYSYGYSKYSFPLSPDIFSGRIWSGTPERGDVAVFRLPTDTNIDYIKRVIGLPGDTVQMRDGQLFLNGKAVPKEPVAGFTDDDFRNGFGTAPTIRRFKETLPNGVSYSVLDARPSGADNTAEYRVPEGHYFMMGDNRDNSTDSRFQREVGFVPLENFIGRAEVIFFSADRDFRIWRFWEWPLTVRFSRFFDGVD